MKEQSHYEKMTTSSCIKEKKNFKDCAEKKINLKRNAVCCSVYAMNELKFTNKSLNSAMRYKC